MRNYESNPTLTGCTFSGNSAEQRGGGMSNRENSKAALRFIAQELSPDVYISLMSQYYPTPAVADHPKLGRCLTADEYEEVIEESERLGFHRGFVQELSSSRHYRPDFRREHPFER